MLNERTGQQVQESSADSSSSSSSEGSTSDEDDIDFSGVYLPEGCQIVAPWLKDGNNKKTGYADKKYAFISVFIKIYFSRELSRRGWSKKTRLVVLIRLVPRRHLYDVIEAHFGPRTVVCVYLFLFVFLLCLFLFVSFFFLLFS